MDCTLSLGSSFLPKPTVSVCAARDVFAESIALKLFSELTLGTTCVRVVPAMNDFGDVIDEDVVNELDMNAEDMETADEKNNAEVMVHENNFIQENVFKRNDD